MQATSASEREVMAAGAGKWPSRLAEGARLTLGGHWSGGSREGSCLDA
jgi:hypothetical protein